MRVKFIIVIILAFTIGAMTALFLRQGGFSSTSGNSVKTTGKALIGGAFQLTDHTGKRVTDKDFHGKFMLVYFGYTFCPDVCPTELQVISAALDKLGQKADRITPVFITIDPQRDTPETLAPYVTHFHKSLIGLTGSSDEIRRAAKAYRVYYARAKSEGEDPDAKTGYLMNHSSIIFLMGPDGTFATHFPHTTDPDKLAEKLSKFL